MGIVKGIMEEVETDFALRMAHTRWAVILLILPFSKY